MKFPLFNIAKKLSIQPLSSQLFFLFHLISLQFETALFYVKRFENGMKESEFKINIAKITFGLKR
ncbi:hypothetical protein AKG39_00580 [Acetobacterium bakii]|uniref:Uncharacterized protein n=1 Tax=Acetobacterium bakii TaxID=52689 RepID=A0A0L6U4W0_9FIRM|nr:hypothetical protein AKG39_00580 [Acetobacterium bakii]